MEEKYARMMMRYTHPEEYAPIEGRLRPLDPATERLVDDIVGIVIPWEDALVRKYPGSPGGAGRSTVRRTPNR